MASPLRRFSLIITVTAFFNCAYAQTGYYFGNLHSHTAFSDGNKDSTASGVFSPAGSYSYAKLSDDFDFLGISEHNHYSSSKNPGFRLPRYQQGLDMADQANAEGSFVALFGMEYGVSSEYNGHVLVYGYNKLLGWETTVPGQTGNNYDIYNGKSDYDGLFRKINSTPGAFCYLAHPSFSDFSSDGTWNGALANAPYNASYDSAIVGMPLRSGLATSTANNYNDYSTGNYFNYYKKMLYTGYHLGLGYDHDNHYTNFGRSNGGRLAVITTSLTRQGITDAIRNMHFYGSDDANARLEFGIGGNIMGSIISGSTYPTLLVKHSDPDGESADTIKIWKGHRNSGGLWAEIILIANLTDLTSITDTDVKPGTEYYYFAEVKQHDGQWIVSSPIWFTGLPAMALEENSASSFSYYPNPVTGKLSIDFASEGGYDVLITDVSGKTALRAHCRHRAVQLDISALERGAYTLHLKNRETGVSRRGKLVVE